MSKLLSMKGEDQFTDDQLISVVFTFLLAGTVTVFKITSAAIHELLKHPDIYKRTLDELDAVVGTTRLVEESDIPKLLLLQNIIKETLRLRHSGPMLIPHGNFAACEVAGYQIQANSTMLVNLYPVFRDPAFWDSPLEFSPYRFTHPKLANLLMQGSDFHYVPFGYGKRSCPGLNLGMISVQYALALCLQSISWDLHTPRRAKLEALDQDLVVSGKLRVNPRLLHDAL